MSMELKQTSYKDFEIPQKTQSEGSTWESQEGIKIKSSYQSTDFDG